MHDNPVLRPAITLSSRVAMHVPELHIREHFRKAKALDRQVQSEV